MKKKDHYIEIDMARKSWKGKKNEKKKESFKKKER